MVDHDELKLLHFLEVVVHVDRGLEVRVQVVHDGLCFADGDPRVVAVFEDLALGVGLGKDVQVLEVAARNVQGQLH